jgi:hypothetical protein
MARRFLAAAKWLGVLLAVAFLWLAWETTGPHEDHPFVGLGLLIIGAWTGINARLDRNRSDILADLQQISDNRRF